MCKREKRERKGEEIVSGFILRIYVLSSGHFSVAILDTLSIVSYSSSPAISENMKKGLE